jgi:hypothetical protein
MRKTLPFVLLVLILFSSVAFAVDPETKPDETRRTSDLQRDSHEGAPLPFPEQMVAGEVRGPDDKDLGGVMVKLFADGRLIEVTHTTSAGAYEIRLPLSVEEDDTVVLWFIATTDNLLPQCVILKKSSAATRANIFSKCTPEVRMQPQIRVDVRMLTEGDLAASLKVKNCL